MNVKELIEKYKRYEGKWNGKTGELARQIFLEDLKQLDEPRKVKVKKFVADWIEKCKNNFGFNLKSAMNINTILHYSDDCHKMIDWIKVNSNQETFARAWLDGYEVEEEKRYYVRFKWIEDSYSYLTLIKHLHAWTLKNITLDKKFRTAHTRKQLEEAGFGWVFDCPGIEIEEVER